MGYASSKLTGGDNSAWAPGIPQEQISVSASAFGKQRFRKWQVLDRRDDRHERLARPKKKAEALPESSASALN
jgi:hypothetical protein